MSQGSPKRRRVAGESGGNPDGPEKDEGMAGRARSSPNHHLSMKRRKCPLFWLPSHQGQHERQPSSHQADGAIIANISSPSPPNIPKKRKHLRSLSRDSAPAANQPSLPLQTLQKPCFWKVCPLHDTGETQISGTCRDRRQGHSPFLGILLPWREQCCSQEEKAL